MDISTMQTSIENERRRAMQQQGDLRMEPKIHGGWDVAREANMEDRPYRLFRAPKDSDDEPGWGFGVDETGQGFFVPIPRIPFNERVQNPKTNDMMIANRTYTADDVLMPLTGGGFLEKEHGIYGHILQNEGGYLKEGKMYDQGIHGIPIPLV